MLVEVEQLRSERERVTALAGQGTRLIDAIIHHSPHGIIVCDADGKMTVQNAASVRIWRGNSTSIKSHDWTRYGLFDRDGEPMPLEDWPLVRSLRGEVVEEIEVRVIRFDGTPGVFLGTTAPIRNVAGAIEGALCVFTDITELRAISESEREARRRIARLQQMTSALSEARTARDIGRVVAHDIADVLGATKAALALPEGDDLIIVASAGFAARAPMRFPIASAMPLAVAYRTGTPVWCTTAEALAREFVGVDFEAQAIACFPVHAGGRVVGALGFGWDAPQSFTDDARELVSDLAHQVALALDRARLYDVATRRGREMELLFHLARATSAATSLDELYDRVLAGITELLGVERASILLFDHANVMRFVAWRGLSGAYRRAVDGHSPWRPDTVDAQPLFIVDAERDASMAGYREVFAAEGVRSLGFIPLIHDARVIGKLMIYGAEARVFTAEDTQLALTIAATVTQSVVRARAAEAERAAARRLELLARASRPLVESALDQRALLRAFAAALGRAIDGAVLAGLVTDDGSAIIPAGSFHPDVEAGDLLASIVELRTGSMLGTVALTGKSVLVPSITSGEAARLVPAFRVLVERFPLHALLCVPMHADKRVIGTLLVARTRAGQSFIPDDVRMFEEIAERAALALTNARLFARVEESNRSRDGILAVVSHDLRAPLSSIMMAANVVPRELGQLERQFSMIRRNADQMTRLISDLLDFASIQAGRLAIERSWFAPEQVLSAVLEMFTSTTAERGVLLTALPIEPVELMSDRGRLIQALGNLVANAVNVTPAGARVEISAEVAPRSVIFSVRDEGPGIASEEQPHLFERYWRSSKAGYRGHGLGLAITSGIVEALGGRIWLTSEVGAGSTFSFSVPR
jgi:signal transduction histidine kinase